MKYRIIQIGTKFYPQERILFVFWTNTHLMSYGSLFDAEWALKTYIKQEQIKPIVHKYEEN